MRVLSDEEACKWYRTRALLARDSGVHYKSEDVSGIEIQIERSDLVSLAHRLVAYDLEAPNYQGSLLWITRWAVWHTWYLRGEDVATKILERMRLSYGEERPLDEAANHLFDMNEYDDQVAFLVMAMLGECDAYLVPAQAEYFVRLSHEGYAYVVTPTRDLIPKLMKEFEPWKPQEKIPQYLK